MTALRELSIFWSLAHTVVMIFILFESRYPKKKTMAITISVMLPLIIANCIISLVLDSDKLDVMMVLTHTIPMALLFYIMAKNRDGRFFFTFFSVDTVVLEVFYITQIINLYTTPDTYIVMFTLRLIVYPIIEILMYKKLRKMYLEVQRSTTKGWKTFSFISVIFHIIFTLLMTSPSPITEQPKYYPVIILLFILMPVVYIHIISTLQYQLHLFEMTQLENILKVQVSDMTARIAEFSEANNKFRIERHNFRHKMQTITRMIENGEYESLKNLVWEYSEAMQETKVKRYCENAVLDAVLSSYLTKAEQKGIVVTTNIKFPEVLPCSDTELATVFANAIENAINASEKLDTSKTIDIKVLKAPKFMLRIANSFSDNITFDKNHIPVTHEEGHGFGTKSIVAFCEKYGAFCEFKTDGNIFILQIVF